MFSHEQQYKRKIPQKEHSLTRLDTEQSLVAGHKSIFLSLMMSSGLGFMVVVLRANMRSKSEAVKSSWIGLLKSMARLTIEPASVTTRARQSSVDGTVTRSARKDSERDARKVNLA